MKLQYEQESHVRNEFVIMSVVFAKLHFFNNHLKSIIVNKITCGRHSAHSHQLYAYSRDKFSTVMIIFLTFKIHWFICQSLFVYF